MSYVLNDILLLIKERLLALFVGYLVFCGAGDGIRTRDLFLGKEAFYY